MFGILGNNNNNNNNNIIGFAYSVQDINKQYDNSFYIKRLLPANIYPKQEHWMDYKGLYLDGSKPVNYDKMGGNDPFSKYINSLSMFDWKYFKVSNVTKEVVKITKDDIIAQFGQSKPDAVYDYFVQIPKIHYMEFQAYVTGVDTRTGASSRKYCFVVLYSTEPFSITLPRFRMGENLVIVDTRMGNEWNSSTFNPCWGKRTSTQQTSRLHPAFYDMDTGAEKDIYGIAMFPVNSEVNSAKKPIFATVGSISSNLEKPRKLVRSENGVTYNDIDAEFKKIPNMSLWSYFDFDLIWRLFVQFETGFAYRKFSDVTHINSNFDTLIDTPTNTHDENIASGNFTDLAKRFSDKISAGDMIFALNTLGGSNTKLSVYRGICNLFQTNFTTISGMWCGQNAVQSKLGIRAPGNASNVVNLIHTPPGYTGNIIAYKPVLGSILGGLASIHLPYSSGAAMTENHGTRNNTLGVYPVLISLVGGYLYNSNPPHYRESSSKFTGALATQPVGSNPYISNGNIYIRAVYKGNTQPQSPTQSEVNLMTYRGRTGTSGYTDIANVIRGLFNIPVGVAARMVSASYTTTAFDFVNYHIINNGNRNFYPLSLTSAPYSKSYHADCVTSDGFTAVTQDAVVIYFIINPLLAGLTKENYKRALRFRTVKELGVLLDSYLSIKDSIIGIYPYHTGVPRVYGSANIGIPFNVIEANRIYVNPSDTRTYFLTWQQITNMRNTVGNTMVPLIQNKQISVNWDSELDLFTGEVLIRGKRNSFKECTCCSNDGNHVWNCLSFDMTSARNGGDSHIYCNPFGRSCFSVDKCFYSSSHHCSLEHANNTLPAFKYGHNCCEGTCRL